MPGFVITDHVEPALVDLSILYPVIVEPPLLVGRVQCRLIYDDDADAVSPRGGVDVLVVIVLDWIEASAR